MMLAWCLILAVTLVSTVLLMIFGEYLAILTETQVYFQTSRTMVLFLSNTFNIFHALITPLIFNSFNKNYYPYVFVSTAAVAFASVGRYLTADQYWPSFIMATIIAIAHIPIISAPYGLLKLFPQWQRGYAASIPLFLPVLGINFCIIYDMIYITPEGNQQLPASQIKNELHYLDQIIAIVAVISSVITLILMHLLKDKIVEKEEAPSSQNSIIQETVSLWKNHRLTIIAVICWGSIVGMNWTYGALFGVIFQGQGLSGKDIAWLGLAANLSTAIFSNLGTFIKNRYGASNTSIIAFLNLIGFLAVIILNSCKYINMLSNLYLMIALLVVLRAGFSSFVSLAFVEMQSSGISSVMVSTIFFWVANVVNLAGMQIIDLIDIDISLMLTTAALALCINYISQTYIKIRTNK